MRGFIHDTIVEIPAGEKRTKMELGISVRINKPYAEEESVTHWSIDKHVVATTGGDINCASSCSTVVAVRRALRVYFLTSG